MSLSTGLKHTYTKHSCEVVDVFPSFQLAALFLTLVLVEGRMVTRREKKDGVVVGQAGKLMSRVEIEGVNKRVVRQADEEDGREAGPFDLFGQVINSFGKNKNCGLEKHVLQ